MWRIQENTTDYIDLIHCQEDLRQVEFLSYSKTGSYFVNCVLSDEGEVFPSEEGLCCPKCKDPLPEVFKIQIKILAG